MTGRERMAIISKSPRVTAWEKIAESLQSSKEGVKTEKIC